MLETTAIILLVIVTWINWSKFYIKRKIRKSLAEVEVGHPVRVLVDFSHYLWYFKINMRDEDEIIIIEYEGKKIRIAPDGNETILYVEE